MDARLFLFGTKIDPKLGAAASKRPDDLLDDSYTGLAVFVAISLSHTTIGVLRQ